MHPGGRQTAPHSKVGCNGIIISVICHNSTLILIESGYCYFYQKPQYFRAFQRFKADLGSSRGRPFLLFGIFRHVPRAFLFVMPKGQAPRPNVFLTRPDPCHLYLLVPRSERRAPAFAAFLEAPFPSHPPQTPQPTQLPPQEHAPAFLSRSIPRTTRPTTSTRPAIRAMLIRLADSHVNIESDPFVKGMRREKKRQNPRRFPMMRVLRDYFTVSFCASL